MAASFGEREVPPSMPSMPPSAQHKRGLETACLAMCTDAYGCGSDCSRALTYNSYERGIPMYVPFRQGNFVAPFPVGLDSGCTRVQRQVDHFEPNPLVKSILQRVIDENTGADSRD
jgi:hypothetical protein